MAKLRDVIENARQSRRSHMTNRQRTINNNQRIHEGLKVKKKRPKPPTGLRLKDLP